MTTMTSCNVSLVGHLRYIYIIIHFGDILGHFTR